ncbi:MAG: hypothetical protein BJ554DRAFT_3558 [Olpidium bornovanus]|uniref:Uncharacterized protein n=1 Tax=Olpidium bornovanus TaxID=278681 RepID=A0A8H7ZP50_9FUNG|nr:MAG: hypothetical protein BJ554DRAFT_3558 [Olpidium bornovanus]
MSAGFGVVLHRDHLSFVRFNQRDFVTKPGGVSGLRGTGTLHAGGSLSVFARLRDWHCRHHWRRCRLRCWHCWLLLEPPPSIEPALSIDPPPAIGQPPTLNSEQNVVSQKPPAGRPLWRRTWAWTRQNRSWVRPSVRCRRCVSPGSTEISLCAGAGVIGTDAIGTGAIGTETEVPQGAADCPAACRPDLVTSSVAGVPCPGVVVAAARPCCCGAAEVAGLDASDVADRREKTDLILEINTRPLSKLGHVTPAWQKSGIQPAQKPISPAFFPPPHFREVGS